MRTRMFSRRSLLASVVLFVALAAATLGTAGAGATAHASPRPGYPDCSAGIYTWKTLGNTSQTWYPGVDDITKAEIHLIGAFDYYNTSLYCEEVGVAGTLWAGTGGYWDDEHIQLCLSYTLGQTCEGDMNDWNFAQNIAGTWSWSYFLNTPEAQLADVSCFSAASVWAAIYAGSNHGGAFFAETYNESCGSTDYPY